MNVFIGPNIRNQFSKVATVFALLSGIGIVSKYFDKSQNYVTAYSFPVSNLGSGPIVSTITLSNALFSYCKCLVCLVVLDLWHMGHFLMFSHMSLNIIIIADFVNTSLLFKPLKELTLVKSSISIQIANIVSCRNFLSVVFPRSLL